MLIGKPLMQRINLLMTVALTNSTLGATSMDTAAFWRIPTRVGSLGTTKLTGLDRPGKLDQNAPVREKDRDALGSAEYTKERSSSG